MFLYGALDSLFRLRGWKAPRRLELPQGSYMDVVLTITLCLAVGTLLALGPQLTAWMWLASLSYGVLCVGLYFRRTAARHVPLMLIGIFLDWGLVLGLEVSRGAVETALSSDLTALQQSHVICSALAALLYVWSLRSGWRLWKHRPANRLWHKRIGLIAFSLRTLGFFLMFSLLPRYQ